MRLTLTFAPAEFQTSVHRVIVRQMAEYLRTLPRLCLCDDYAVAKALIDKGFGIESIANLLDEARYQAWRLWDGEDAIPARFLARRIAIAGQQRVIDFMTYEEKIYDRNFLTEDAGSLAQTARK